MKKILLTLWLTATLFTFTAYGDSCCKVEKSSNSYSIQCEPFGTLPSGETVLLYTLKNATGMEMTVMDYGATVVSLTAPDKNGAFADVVEGFDNLADYVEKSPYFGCIVGRYGNRIANGKFTLEGTEYQLAKNNGDNALHGGVKGFDKVLWKGQAVQTCEGPAVIMRYTSKDGEEGYPGNLCVEATIILTNDNALKITIKAKTDKVTLANLTHHGYFNLAGSDSILDHEVVIDADHFTPVDEGLIPTGELRPVAGTPFDFTAPHTIGERINETNLQLKYGLGYDHNWVLNKQANELTRAATVYEKTSGRVMEVWTTHQGLQFYTGNFLDGTLVGKAGKKYPFRSAFCMEPQTYPDAPNKQHFPSSVLRPGATYFHEITYKFSTK